MEASAQEIPERRGEAFELDEQLTVVGRQLAAGDGAPDFGLECFDPEAETMRVVSLAESAGRVRVINVINSLDTPVCHRETRRWEELRADLPEDVVLYTVSMDLPFGQARWRSEHGVEHEALSAHASEEFGVAYGVLLKEWRLLQRAIFVIDADRIVTYAEYVADQMTEPDYAAAIAAAAT
ncbi:MAG TPA: thiol peroxidase [Solirubrobacteraceae bacterium]|jgi:thiol peroxidase|nr:thiol peroxidase [Solirubrobacteraceae bacterium]